MPWKNIFNNLKLVIKHQLTDIEIERKINKVLEDLDISDIKFLYLNQLSGGMKQKVNIARVLLYESSIILLDEPFKSLDIKSKNNIIDIIIKTNKEKGITVNLVTHDKLEARILGDVIYLLKGEPVKLVMEAERSSIDNMFDEMLNKY